MLPVLQAQERLATVDAMVYAQGAMKDEDSQRYIERLRTVAQRQKLEAESLLEEERPAVAARPKSMQEMMGLVGGHSVQMQLVRGPEHERMERERQEQEATES